MGNKNLSIGVLGGSFNPPHVGHLLACQYILSVHSIDYIWLIPVSNHPFGKELEDINHRLEMCQLMAGYNRNIAAVNIENVYTIDLVRKLISSYNQIDFSLIIGSDILGEQHRWKNFDEIKSLISIVVMQRGSKPIDGYVSIQNISSTDIRNRIALGLDVSRLLPENVLKYIMDEGLYGISRERG